MKTTITAKNMVVTPGINDRIMRKVSKMGRYLDQNTEISKEFSLWKQSGSSYKRGDLFVIPIGTSLLYVEPVYLEATNQAIPEVKRVIVAYQDKIAYEPTLSEALLSLFGGSAGDGGSKIDGLDDGGGNDDVASLIKKAQNAYRLDF